MTDTIAAFGVIVISYASTFGLACLRSMYKNIPFPEFLDSIYLNSRLLQSIFSYRYGANSSELSLERDAHHLAAICGLKFESINARTVDGFSLALHHVYLANDWPNKKRPLLLLPHPLQSSDTFLLGGRTSLAFYLVHAGYDVYIGNYRGNKYSFVHAKYTPEQDNYWDFSLDEVINTDIPAFLYTVQASSSCSSRITVVGFSHGCLLASCAFVAREDVRNIMRGLVALSPPTKSLYASNTFFVRMLQQNKALFSMILGNKSFMKNLTLWREVLSPSMFAKIVRTSLKYLLNWSTTNISTDRQTQFYQNIFSSTSTKVVRHLLQIEESGTFVSYKKEKRSWISLLLGHYPKEPRRQHEMSNISCPVGIIAGGADTLFDRSLTHRTFKSIVYEHIQVHGYEHLDIQLADEVVEKIFPRVLAALDTL